MVLGPPRSGKTSAVMIPAVMGASGAVISTSTKPEVMRATVAARSEVGQAWLFDPSGAERAAARGGAAAVLVAGGGGDELGRGAGDGAGDGGLHAAGKPARRTRATGPSARRRCWRRCSMPPTSPAGRSPRSCAGRCARTSSRRAWRCSTATRRSPPTCWPGSSGPTRASAPRSSPPPPASSPPTTPTRSGRAPPSPNFDPARFAASTDTIYVTAPEHRQALCAPLIVGLLEQIRHAVYERAATGRGRAGDALGAG